MRYSSLLCRAVPYVFFFPEKVSLKSSILPLVRILVDIPGVWLLDEFLEKGGSVSMIRR